MKYLKMLTVAAIAAAALTAVAGAGSASATVLCKTLTNPCGSSYPTGTEYHANTVVNNYSLIEWKIGEAEFTEICTKQALAGSSENLGGAAETVRIKLKELTWVECVNEESTLKLPQLEVHYTKEGNGTLVGKGGEFKLREGVFPFSFCTYTLGTETKIGTLTGGSEALWEVNAELKRVAGSCGPATKTWKGRFKFDKPTPLYMAAS
ncbi:MAG TPA: hypothetical protein VKB23_12950 [Solirubrobacterales bacterium]|nr:hypothetical protein [Solirubrobacterales bacterium]